MTKPSEKDLEKANAIVNKSVQWNEGNDRLEPYWRVLDIPLKHDVSRALAAERASIPERVMAALEATEAYCMGNGDVRGLHFHVKVSLAIKDLRAWIKDGGG